MFKKATGLLPGVSDLIVLQKNEALFIEVKDAHGKQRPDQKIFEEKVKNLGFSYHLVRSLDDFKNIVLNLVKQLAD